MTKITNPRRLRAEDFPKEYDQLVSQLGLILNNFMEESVNIFNGRIDFENLNQEVTDYEVTVDSDGVPQLNNKLRLNKASISGMIVLNARNLTNSTIYPDSAPYVVWESDGTGLYTINKVLGIPADNKFRLTLLIINR